MVPYPPPPPRSSGMSTGLIVAIVVVPIVLFVGLMVFFVVLGAVMARSSAKRAARAAAYAPPPALTESHATKNALVVAHYPSAFGAKSLDDATLVISKNNADGTDEMVQVAAVPDPITDDVNEFGRLLVDAMRKNIEAAGDRWTETARAHRACFKGYPGLEIDGTFTAKGITKEKVRICFFMDGNRGYELKSLVPEVHEATDLPTLQAIIDATDVK